MTTWSADSHVIEPVEVLREYFDARWRSAAPRLVATSVLGDVLTVDGMSLVLPISEVLGTGPVGWPAVPKASWDAQERSAYQRRVGVDGELIFPTLGLFMNQHPDKGFRYAFADAYNRWLADQWCGRQGLAMVALLAQHETAGQRAKAIAAATDAGFAGLLLPSEPVRGSWGAADYADLFAGLADAGLIACFHVFSRPIRSSVSRPAAAVFAAAHEAMDLFCELVLSDVLAQEPDLRVVVGEGETWWLPTWERKLQSRGADLESARRALRVTTDRRPEHGAEFTIYSSDFPHSSEGHETPIWLPQDVGGFANGSFLLRLP